MAGLVEDLGAVATKTHAFIPIRVGHLWLTLDAHVVHEIVGARTWVPVPHSSPLMPGVLAWRGRAVAVLDLSVLASAGEPLRAGAPRPRTLVVESADCVLAMPVDGVREVQEVDASRVRAPHVTTLHHAAFEVEMFGTLAPLLDVSSLVAAVLGSGGAGHES